MGDSLKSLERLGDEFERVARADGIPRRRWWRAGRPLFASIVLVGATGAVALAAAGGLLTGDPVVDPQANTDPRAGLGVAEQDGIELTALRVADPDGGPPWGLRTVRTSRGILCVQIGRVVDGRLGVLGQDGAFANDGRFHPYSRRALDGLGCQVTDGAGQAFTAVTTAALPASGSGQDCIVRPAPLPASFKAPKGFKPHAPLQRPLCPERDLRTVAYGLLGPRGKAVGYRDRAGHTRSAAAVGRRGAYLVVKRAAQNPPAGGSSTMAATPGNGLISVTYRDGSLCRIPDPRRSGGARRCPAKGAVRPRASQVTSADVATRIHASVAAEPVVPVGASSGARSWALTISFTARVAADARSTYVFEVRPTQSAGCTVASAGAVVSHDVAAGTVVSQTQYLPLACKGAVVGRVAYALPGPLPRSGPPYPEVAGQPSVGTFTAWIPAR